MADPVPTWKFWHPLPVWHVFVILAVMQLSFTFVVVALREAAGIVIPFGEHIAAGLGGGLGVFIITSLARRKRDREAAA